MYLVLIYGLCFQSTEVMMGVPGAPASGGMEGLKSQLRQGNADSPAGENGVTEGQEGDDQKGNSLDIESTNQVFNLQASLLILSAVLPKCTVCLVLFHVSLQLFAFKLASAPPEGGPNM